MVGTAVSMESKSPVFLRACEVAERYGFSQRHWYRLVERQDAPQAIHFGGLARWRLEDLLDWEANDCKPPTKR